VGQHNKEDGERPEYVQVGQVFWCHLEGCGDAGAGSVVGLWAEARALS